MDFRSYNKKHNKKVLLKQKMCFREKEIAKQLLVGIFFFLCWIPSLVLFYLGVGNIPVLLGTFGTPLFFITTFIDLLLSRRNLFTDRNVKMYKGFPFYIPPFLVSTYDRIWSVVFDFNHGIIIVKIKGRKRRKYYSHWYTEKEMETIKRIFHEKGVIVGVRDEY